ncbi:MAG: ATP-binding protein, partial [Gammaproteobacteria bacterium]
DHYISQHPHITAVRLNMDKMTEREQIKAGQLESLILTSIQRRLEPHQCVWVTIDEAQKCPEVFEQIKVLYDQYKDQQAIKFIITGSALLELHRLSAESLAGRINLYYLSAFNLAESARLTYDVKIDHSIFDLIDAAEQDENHWREFLNDLMPYSNVLKQTLAELQIWGGLPEVLVLSDSNERLDYLANYLQTYLEKDVRAITSITDLTLYRHLMDIAAEQTGSVRNDARLLQALGCHRETLAKYRGYLQATLMYQESPPYINTTLKRLVKAPKGYLINNGLVSFLEGIYDLDILIKTGKIGHRLENWFFNEIQVWLNRNPGRHSVHYWRTSAGAEVDFVVSKRPNIYPFEVTYSSFIEPKKVQNLIRFREYEAKTEFAFYIYLGDFKFDHKNKIIFIPAWAVC